MIQNDSTALADIRAHHLFAGLSPPQLQRLLTTAGIEEADAGQLLFDRGQPARHFYVVLEGQVNLVLYSRAGEEKIVDILGPGQSCAEAIMFMEGPAYPVSAMAASRARIARFSSVDYVAMLRESPETCLRMLGHLSQRLHMRIREIEHLTLESAAHRLVRLIESRLPADTDGPAEIQLQESRQEIASRLSMKPETLSRILRTLSDSGTISVQGRVLRVPSRRQLLSILDTAA
jgi:CRP-like cAMP-binding protein